jgi:hypothetical protein
VSAEIGAVAERLDGMNVPERRDLLRRLHFQVTVRPDGTKARIAFAGQPFLASQGILPALLFDASTPDHAPRTQQPVVLAPVVREIVLAGIRQKRGRAVQ